jgi:hypothetical protein
MDEEILQQLRDGGVDELLAKHYAHLFIRDPLVVFKELLNVDDSQSSDHFEVWFLYLFRISNRPTGKRCDSSLLLQGRLLGGVLNSDRWIFN